MQVVDVRLAHPGPCDAGFQVGVDGMLFDQALGEDLRVLAEPPVEPRIIESNHLFKRHLILPLPAAQLSAVAPRGAKAEALRLQ